MMEKERTHLKFKLVPKEKLVELAREAVTRSYPCFIPPSYFTNMSFEFAFLAKAKMMKIGQETIARCQISLPRHVTTMRYQLDMDIARLKEFDTYQVTIRKI